MVFKLTNWEMLLGKEKMQVTCGTSSCVWSMFYGVEPAETSKLCILDAFHTIKNFWMMFPVIVSEIDNWNIARAKEYSASDF